APLFHVYTLQRKFTASRNAYPFPVPPNLICQVILYGEFNQHIDEKSAIFLTNLFS
ncbi:hypothetical protein COCVIDRAFT_87856, partial [Bipolaris victoriae FI3]